MLGILYLFVNYDFIIFFIPGYYFFFFIHRKFIKLARSLRSNHSTWDPRRPLYEELKAPPLPRRGQEDCYGAHSHCVAGRFLFWFITNWVGF